MLCDGDAGSSLTTDYFDWRQILLIRGWDFWWVRCAGGRDGFEVFFGFIVRVVGGEGDGAVIGLVDFEIGVGEWAAVPAEVNGVCGGAYVGDAAAMPWLRYGLAGCVVIGEFMVARFYCAKQWDGEAECLVEILLLH